MELRSKTMTSPLTAGVKSSKRKHEGDASSHDSYNNNDRKKETAKNSPSTSTSNSSNEDKKRKIGDDDRKPAAAAAATGTGTAFSKGIGEDGNNNKEKETIAAFKDFLKNIPSTSGKSAKDLRRQRRGGHGGRFCYGRKKKPTSPTKGFNFGVGNNASSAGPYSESPASPSGAPPGFAPSSSSSSCPFKHGPGNKTNSSSSSSSAPRQRSQNDNGVVVIPHYSLKVHYKTLEMVDDDENYLDNNPRAIYVKKFKRLCLIYHPDKNNGKDRKFKELNNARDAIREYYDFTWH